PAEVRDELGLARSGAEARHLDAVGAEDADAESSPLADGDRAVGLTRERHQDERRVHGDRTARADGHPPRHPIDDRGDDDDATRQAAHRLTELEPDRQFARPLGLRDRRSGARRPRIGLAGVAHAPTPHNFLNSVLKAPGPNHSPVLAASGVSFRSLMLLESNTRRPMSSFCTGSIPSIIRMAWSTYAQPSL